MAKLTIQNILEEPTITYAATSSRMDLVTLSRRGVTKQALINLGTTLGLTLTELAELLPVTKRTLQRREPNNLLSSHVSEQIILIAELAEKGSAVWGSITSFKKWLKEENTALGGHQPLNLLDTAIGIELVSEELDRLEYGIYA